MVLVWRLELVVVFLGFFMFCLLGFFRDIRVLFLRRLFYLGFLGLDCCERFGNFDELGWGFVIVGEVERRFWFCCRSFIVEFLFFLSSLFLFRNRDLFFSFLIKRIREREIGLGVESYDGVIINIRYVC